MMVAKHEPVHFLFDDVVIKWEWRESELIRFREMWADGEDAKSIAGKFKTNIRSIALLVMDQAESGHIKKRNNGLFGN